MGGIQTLLTSAAPISISAGLFSGEFLGAVVGGLIAGLISLLVVYAHLRSEQRNKDDELYGRAFKAVMDWMELPYRTLRARDDSVEQQRELRNRFHELQEDIQYHRGWIGFRSNRLGISYENFAYSTKALVSPCIQKLEADPGYSRKELIAEMAEAKVNVDREIEIFRDSVQHRRSWYGRIWEHCGRNKFTDEN